MITAKAFKVPVFGWFLRKVQEIPVPLTQGSTALEEAQRQIGKGRSVAIFIEGHISPLEGGFLPPRSGAARLALSTGIPIVPVGISLRREHCKNIRSRIAGGIPSEARWYLHGPYAITVGEPALFEGDVEDHAHVNRVSESIMEKIRALAHESDGRLQGWETYGTHQYKRYRENFIHKGSYVKDAKSTKRIVELHSTVLFN